MFGLAFALIHINQRRNAMKPIYFLFNMFSILFFGLVCCKSDNANNPDAIRPSETQEGPQVEKIIFSHEDRSIHNLVDTKIIQLNSNIELQLHNVSDNQLLTIINTECSANFLQGLFSKQAQVAGSHLFPVKDLIPLEMFTPSKKKNPEVRCNFQMEVFSQNQSIAQANINNLLVGGFNQYSISDPMFTGYTYNKIFYRDQFDSAKRNLSFSEGIFRTQCESEYKDEFVYQPEFHYYIEYLNDFFLSLLIHCLLVNFLLNY